MEKISKNVAFYNINSANYIQQLVFDSPSLSGSYQGTTFSTALSSMDFYFDQIQSDTDEEVDNIIAIYNDHFLEFELDIIKKEKIQVINGTTDELLLHGYQYGEYYFPVLSEDQRNYLGLNMAALNQLVTGTDMLTFGGDDGLKVKGHDGQGNTVYHSFTDCGDIINFFMTGMGYVNAILKSGWQLKDQVNIASTIEQVNAIEDNR